MNNQNLNLIFYHYIHYNIIQKFPESRIISCSEVCNFITTKFRIPRQIKKRVLWDLEAIGLIELVKGDKIVIKEPTRILHI